MSGMKIYNPPLTGKEIQRFMNPGMRAMADFCSIEYKKLTGEYIDPDKGEEQIPIGNISAAIWFGEWKMALLVWKTIQ